MKREIPPAILNGKQAARYLGVSLETFRNLRDVPAVQMPGMAARRYAVAHLDEWINKHTVNPE